MRSNFRIEKRFGMVLLDYLNGSFWTLGFTCSADKAFFNFNGNRLSLFYFVNTHWTRVDTCSASGALVVVNYNFYQFSSSLFQLDFIQVKRVK